VVLRVSCDVVRTRRATVETLFEVRAAEQVERLKRRQRKLFRCSCFGTRARRPTLELASRTDFRAPWSGQGVDAITNRLLHKAPDLPGSEAGQILDRASNRRRGLEVVLRVLQEHRSNLSKRHKEKRKRQ
jgi:hypothetical protein